MLSQTSAPPQSPEYHRLEDRNQFPSPLLIIIQAINRPQWVVTSIVIRDRLPHGPMNTESTLMHSFFYEPLILKHSTKAGRRTAYTLAGRYKQGVAGFPPLLDASSMIFQSSWRGARRFCLDEDTEHRIFPFQETFFSFLLPNTRKCSVSRSKVTCNFTLVPRTAPWVGNKYTMASSV